jgi:C4-dicarboxylate transporter DctM subunit
MDNVTLGLAYFGLTILLIMLRVPVGLAMLLVGGIGFAQIAGLQALLNNLNNATYARFSSYTLSVVPLFLLMGEFGTKAGVNSSLFRATRAWLGHWRGGLAISTIGGCAMFGAICGSSIATAATMTRVALPEMKRYGYSNALSAGTLAAGGTLGILIPPSVVLVIYAIYTEQSIGHLFLGAVIPGLIATVGYMIVVSIYVRLVPDAGPATERASWRERFASLRDIWPVALVFTLVIVGIYQGWFSPTEGAAIGAAATGVIAVVVGGMRWQGLKECLLSTAETTALIFLILFGAELFNAFLALTQMPSAMAKIVEGLNAPPLLVIAAMLLIYLVLGCVMESMAMVLLTLPVFLPILLTLQLGMTPEQIIIWFGILCLMMVEIGMITPPFGLNLFVLKAMSQGIPDSDVYRGVMPFVASDLIRTCIILLLPGTVLWLPGLWK